jgi:hypothetical protein
VAVSAVHAAIAEQMMVFHIGKGTASLLPTVILNQILFTQDSKFAIQSRTSTADNRKE